MKLMPLNFGDPVSLVGGGSLSREMLDEAMAIAPTLVAADGAADRLAAMDLTPNAVIGDMDSIVDLDAWRSKSANILHIAEQDSTDFEKCLTHVNAPLYLAIGFTGRRVDHMLAVLHALLRNADKKIVVLGTEDAIALSPLRIELVLEPGTRVSIFPLKPVRGVMSQGLRWPIDDLSFVTGTQIGTSNEAVSDRVILEFDGHGALVMIERRFLPALVQAIS